LPSTVAKSKGRRVLYGALAATAVAVVGLDATIGARHNYPAFHEFFGDDWLVARNLTFLVLSCIAAFFGYLAIHARSDSPAP